MSILSRFTWYNSFGLPKQLRANINGAALLPDGNVIFTKQSDDTFHLCNMSPDGINYIRSFGPLGDPRYHQRGDSLTPFPIPSGPSQDTRSAFWYDGLLWISFQDTYGSPDLPMPSLYAVDLTTNPPTVYGPWAFTIPHEQTGSQILGLANDGLYFLVTGWDANTFQKGSHGPALAKIKIPDIYNDKACDMTYDPSNQWIHQDDWEHLDGENILFHPRIATAWCVPGASPHPVAMSRFTVPWGVNSDGVVEKGAPPAWKYCGGQKYGKVPYERGPYYVIDCNGSVYPAPYQGTSPVPGSWGWQVSGRPDSVLKMNPMPTKHWASCVMELDGELVFLQSYDVLVDSLRWYGEGGEFAYPRPKDGYPHTPIIDPFGHGTPSVGGRVYHTQSCGISHRGFQESCQRKTIMAWQMKHINGLETRPCEWEMVEECWPGYQDARLLRGYIDPYNADGTVITKRINWDTKVSCMLNINNYLYVCATDATDQGGVMNVLKLK
jgi:hypothetical protein